MEQVDTSAIVVAGVGVTVANVGLAPLASPPRRAVTLVPTHQIAAGATVHAWAGSALVSLYGAVFAGVAIPALALEAVVQVQAGKATGGVAWVLRAVINGHFASQAGETGSALAFERSARVWKGSHMVAVS